MALPQIIPLPIHISWQVRPLVTVLEPNPVQGQVGKIVMTLHALKFLFLVKDDVVDGDLLAMRPSVIAFFF